MTDAQLRTLLRRRFEIDGRTWVVAALYAGEKPWAWLVNIKRPDEQARYPVRRLLEMEPIT